MTGSQLDLIDGGGLADQAARATIAAIAEQASEQRRAKNTKKAYQSDWTTWLQFIESVRRADDTAEVYPAKYDPAVHRSDPQSDALVVYAVWLAGGGRLADGSIRPPSAPETIRRKISGVLAGWREHHLDYPRAVSVKARETVDRIEKELVERDLSTGRGEAPLITPDQLRRIAQTTPDTLSGLRDMALLTIGFAIGARSMELAHLDLSDITSHERGIRVHVRKTKGKTKSRHPRIIYGKHPEVCPVLCWRRWRETSAIVTGPALRQVTRGGVLGGRMSPEAVSARVAYRAKVAKLVDLDGHPILLTGHSLRSGFATAAKEAGKADHKIADQAGWKHGSAAMTRYLRDVTDWDDNVLVGIGL